MTDGTHEIEPAYAVANQFDALVRCGGAAEIKTNDRFDKLTNLDISTHYKDGEYWFMQSDFMGAFAYWVTAQSPYPAPNINSAMVSFDVYLRKTIKNEECKCFSYDELNELISEKNFELIPEILELNKRKNGREGYGVCSRYDKPSPDDDFIDLGALARNVFYMMLRQSITQS